MRNTNGSSYQGADVPGEKHAVTTLRHKPDTENMTLLALLITKGTQEGNTSAHMRSKFEATFDAEVSGMWTTGQRAKQNFHQTKKWLDLRISVIRGRLGWQDWIELT